MGEDAHEPLAPGRSSDDMIVFLDTGFRVRRWNGGGTRLLGYREDEVLGRTYFTYLREEENQPGAFEDILTDTCRKESPRAVRLKHRTRLGESALLQGVCVPIRATDGGFEGWVLALHSATQDEPAGANLAGVVETLLSDSREALVILDASHRVTSWNPGAELLYGFAAAAVTGKAIEHVLRSPRGAEHVNAMRSEMLRVGIQHRETEHLSKSGEVLRVDVTWSPLRSDSGELTGSVMTIRDVTGHRAMEERLLHSERLAVVGRMAAQVAHELRNPLSSLSLNAELLLDELNVLPNDGAKEARVLLESMTAEIGRLAALSEEYLQFARMPEKNPAPTDVALLAEDIAQFAELELARAAVQVRVVANQVPTLRVDRKQLRQALLNLIRNALEAMEEGGTLTISTQLIEETNEVEIAVADTGPGIEEGQAERIFEPFVSMKESGTGLGLALSRRVAHEHGGEVSYRPTPGGGATFALRLPVPESDGGSP